MKNLSLLAMFIALFSCFQAQALSYLDEVNYGSFPIEDKENSQEKVQKQKMEDSIDHSHDGLENKQWEKQRQEERTRDNESLDYDDEDADSAMND